MSSEKYFTSRSLSYPRSFLGLLVAGFLLVALPLLGTLLYSAWHTERLTEQSRNAVLGAAKAARVHAGFKQRSTPHSFPPARPFPPTGGPFFF